MSNVPPTPKQFAPLDPQKGNTAGAPPLKGIVFDVDGTLWYAFANNVFLGPSHRYDFQNICNVTMFPAHLCHANEHLEKIVFAINDTYELHTVQ